MSNIKKIMIIAIIVLVILLVSYTLYKAYKNTKKYDFKVYFFNAGKADAILISKGDKYMMIDTGEESLSDEILKYFKDNNITKLEYLIITHFDKDHVGSASTIIDNIEIGNIFQSNVPKDSEYYNNYITSLSNKNITPITVSGNYDITLGDVDITINGPEEVYENNESNNSSLIVSITNGNNKFLLTGDAENARLKDYVTTINTTYDFLKVPYHGNYLKRLESLLEKINVSSAVITCSNSEGADTETLELLDKYNINYYLTKNGSIEVLSDGNNIKINQL